MGKGKGKGKRGGEGEGSDTPSTPCSLRLNFKTSLHRYTSITSVDYSEMHGDPTQDRPKSLPFPPPPCRYTSITSVDYSETVIRQAQQLHREKALAGILRREKTAPPAEQRHHDVVASSSGHGAELPPSEQLLLRDIKLSPPSSEQRHHHVAASRSDGAEQLQHLEEPLDPTHGLHFQVCVWGKEGGGGPSREGWGNSAQQRAGRMGAMCRAFRGLSDSPIIM